MTISHSLKSGRSSGTAALLLLALLAAPAAAVAQDSGSATTLGGISQPHLSGTGTAPVATLFGTTAPAYFPYSSQGDDLSSADGVRARQSLPAPQLLDGVYAIAGRSPSLSRHLLIGSGIGAAAGAAFGLAVISLADCGGPNCSQERVVGVAGHALAGAVVGALFGGVTYLIRR